MDVWPCNRGMLCCNRSFGMLGTHALLGRENVALRLIGLWHIYGVQCLKLGLDVSRWQDLQSPIQYW